MLPAVIQERKNSELIGKNGWDNYLITHERCAYVAECLLPRQPPNARDQTICCMSMHKSGDLDNVTITGIYMYMPYMHWH